MPFGPALSGAVFERGAGDDGSSDADLSADIQRIARVVIDKLDAILGEAGTLAARP